MPPVSTPATGNPSAAAPAADLSVPYAAERRLRDLLEPGEIPYLLMSLAPTHGYFPLLEDPVKWAVDLARAADRGRLVGWYDPPAGPADRRLLEAALAAQKAGCVFHLAYHTGGDAWRALGTTGLPAAQVAEHLTRWR